MSKFRNLIYDTVFRNAPVSVQNAYYKWVNHQKAQAWADAPFYLIHIPKSAGTSICDAVNLPDSTHLLFCEFAPDLARKLAAKPCVMIVRDPVDRLISTYTYLRNAHKKGIRNLTQFVGEYDSAEAFLTDVAADPEYRRQYFLRPCHVFLESALDFGADVQLIDFANLNTEVPAFLNKFGYDMVEVPRKNVSADQSLPKPKISADLIAGITQAYKGDYILLERMKAC